jgi:hypothetical protein
MSNQTHPANSPGNGGYERSDIGTRGVLYFLAGLAVAGLLAYFVVAALYSYLEKRSEAQQAPVSPLVTNAPADTRHIPAEYKTDSESTDYEKYLDKNFPAPQLETNERIELTKVRLREENTLSTYDYIDRQAGHVRIPIDRAMDLIAQRGLPVRSLSDQFPNLQTVNCADPHILCSTKSVQQAHTENAKEATKK